MVYYVHRVYFDMALERKTLAKQFMKPVKWYMTSLQFVSKVQPCYTLYL
jgi:hypothetical protein